VTETILLVLALLRHGDDDVDAVVEMYQPAQQQQAGTAVLYTAAGQPVALTVSAQVCQSYKHRQAVACGVILVLCGILSILFNIVAMTWNEIFSFMGHGIWCGFMVGDFYELHQYFL